jgi:hypothetical protein
VTKVEEIRDYLLFFWLAWSQLRKQKKVETLERCFELEVKSSDG